MLELRLCFGPEWAWLNADKKTNLLNLFLFGFVVFSCHLSLLFFPSIQCRSHAVRTCLSLPSKLNWSSLDIRCLCVECKVMAEHGGTMPKLLSSIIRMPRSLSSASFCCAKQKPSGAIVWRWSYSKMRAILLGHSAFFGWTRHHAAIATTARQRVQKMQKWLNFTAFAQV